MSMRPSADAYESFSMRSKLTMVCSLPLSKTRKSDGRIVTTTTRVEVRIVGPDWPNAYTCGQRIFKSRATVQDIFAPIEFARLRLSLDPS